MKFEIGKCYTKTDTPSIFIIGKRGGEFIVLNLFYSDVYIIGDYFGHLVDYRVCEK